MKGASCIIYEPTFCFKHSALPPDPPTIQRQLPASLLPNATHLDLAAAAAATAGSSRPSHASTWPNFPPPSPSPSPSPLPAVIPTITEVAIEFELA